MPTSTINTLEGSFTIEASDAGPDLIPDPDTIGVWTNGIVEVQAPALCCVVCGTTDQSAEVTIESLDRPSGEPGPEWEAVAEISLTSAGCLRVREWASGPHPELVVHIPAGPIRVRVSAQGRDKGLETRWDATREPVHERFLIQAWPAPEAPDQVLRQDHFAEGFQ